MYISVLARRLRPGKTYADFVEAWYPDRGFGMSGRGPFTARSVADENEILTIAFLELAEGEDLDAAMGRIAAQEAVRHQRLDEIIHSTTVRGLYEQIDEFDFTSDETVEAGRP